MKIHFGYLLGLAALGLAGCAAFFSVYGISQLFAGATTAVIVMASALEFSKIIAASYLQRYWSKIATAMKIYVAIGVFVLVCITSAGIYGFLSSAYQETYQKLTINEKEIDFLKQKENFYSNDVARYDEELKSISNNISVLSGAKSTSIQVRDKNSETGFRNTVSTAELRLAQKRIDIEEENRKNIIIKRDIVTDSLQKYQIDILDKESDNDLSAELGPLIYISKIANIPMDRVVNYFILLLIFVFDPLAITLVIATNWVFKEEFKKRKVVIEKNKPKKRKSLFNWFGNNNTENVKIIKDKSNIPPTTETLNDKSENIKERAMEMSNIEIDENELSDGVSLEREAKKTKKLKEEIKNLERKSKNLGKQIENFEEFDRELERKIKINNEDVSVETPHKDFNPLPKTETQVVSQDKTNISSIPKTKTGLNSDEVKEIRNNARNFSRKIPNRHGY